MADKLYYFLPSLLKNWLKNLDSEEQGEVAAGGTEREEVVEEATKCQGVNMEPVRKMGSLICKRVTNENGSKTRMDQRSWKPFNAVLRGMVLHLRKDTFDLCKTDHAIELHHAIAYPIECKKRPHVLSLRTADSRHFYFQAKSEEEQISWVVTINYVAARFSAPPITPVSRDINTHCPQILPSFPTYLSLEQQLQCYKEQVQKVMGHLHYYQSLPVRDGPLTLAYVIQEVKRYIIYVRVLKVLVAKKDAAATPTKG